MNRMSTITILFLMLVSLSTSTQPSQTTCDCQTGTSKTPKNPTDEGPVDGREGKNGINRAAGQSGHAREPLFAIANWKECMWRAGDEVDKGKVMDCMFVKKSSDTVVRVHYGGTIRTSSCKRWYFTFNGAECSTPKSIDGVFNKIKGLNQKILLHHRHIQGYCLNIPKGDVRVGLWVGRCPGKKAGDHISTRYDKDRAANSGWSYVSHIFIEEVEPPKIPS